MSNVRDPELKGLKLLVHAITFKKMENCNVKEMGLGKKVFIEDLALKELNTVTAPWGLEISSVEMYVTCYTSSKYCKCFHTLLFILVFTSACYKKPSR